MSYHEYIQTGHLDSKFGFDLTQLDEAIELINEQYSNLRLKGFNAHMALKYLKLRFIMMLVEIILNQLLRIERNSE